MCFVDGKVLMFTQGNSVPVINRLWGNIPTLTYSETVEELNNFLNDIEPLDVKKIIFRAYDIGYRQGARDTQGMLSSQIRQNHTARVG